MGPPAEGVDLELALAPSGPDRLTFPHFLEDVVARHGSRVAIRFEDRDLGYEELAGRVRRLALALRSAGVEPGDRVALLLANRPEWAIAAFAASAVGAVVVPVNTFATPDERDYILRHSDASLLVMQRELAGRDFVAEFVERHPGLENAGAAAADLDPLPDLRRIVCLSPRDGGAVFESWDEFLAGGDSAGAVAEADLERVMTSVRPEDAAWLIYTSGTTDRPKGVLHSQRAAVIQSWRFAELLALEREDSVFTAQPFFWTAGISMSLGATLAVGARLLLQERFEAGAALDCVESEGATVIHAWVHQEKAMAEHPTAASRDLHRVRCVEFDSPLAPLVGLEEDRWGIHASYGLSETFTLVSALPSWASAEARRGSSGPPLPSMQIRILDPESGAPRGRGEEGEIAVRGVTLMQGYWKVPVEDTFDEAGFFRTGDAGRLDAHGLLHWKGRLSGIIKTGGANVSPLEVERLAGGLPGIRAAVAVGVPHPTLGEALVLCVVPTTSRSIDEDELRRSLRERLAAYKVPRYVIVLEEGEVPTTGTQKLRSDALRVLARERLEAGGIEIAGYVYRGADS